MHESGQPDILALAIALNAPKGAAIRGFIAVDTVPLASLKGGEFTIMPCTQTAG